MREVFPEIPFWLTLQCKAAKGGRSPLLADGALLADLAHEMAEKLRGSNAQGIGVNCVDPELVSLSKTALRDCLATFPAIAFVACPNSGETWHSETPHWRWPGATPIEPATWAANLFRAGTAGSLENPIVLGGCCRVGPDMIRCLCRLKTAME